MTTDNDVKRLTENVMTLQKDMAQVGTLVDRLDVTIEKLTEVSSTVSQLLAVQGNRLEFQEKIQEKLQELVEKRRVETDTAINNVYMRIEKVESDLQEDISITHDKIIAKIEDMQRSGAKQHEEISDKMNERITKLEKWMWTVAGGCVVALWLVNNVDIVSVFAK